MTDNRIRFVTWLLVLSSCPVLKASTNLSCGTAQTAPRKGDKDLVAESQQGKVWTQHQLSVAGQNQPTPNHDRCAYPVPNQDAGRSVGGFAAPRVSAGGFPVATVAGDFSGEVKPDVLLAESQSPSWKAIRSEPGPSTRSAVCCSRDQSVWKFPHPYLVGSLSLNGAGYSPLSETIGAGIRMDVRHVVGEAELSYNNARKTNDNTGYNPKGRERGAQSRVFYKLNNGLYFGIGAQWSQLSTSHYSKQAWRPTVGVGKDFVRETYSLRVQAMYITAGTDRANGVQGPEINITYPSPASSGHLFWRTTWSVYRFHTTDTFSDPATSASQRADHHFTGGTASGLIWRF